MELEELQRGKHSGELERNY
jgi:hypothetical protein